MGFQVRASQQQVEIEELEISLSGQIDNIFVFLGTEQGGHSGFKEISGTLYVASDADDEVLEFTLGGNIGCLTCDEYPDARCES